MGGLLLLWLGESDATACLPGCQAVLLSHPPPHGTGKWASPSWTQDATASRTALCSSSPMAIQGPELALSEGSAEPPLALVVSCICKVRALRGCGRGSFRLGSCCWARIHPQVCHWSYSLFWAEWGVLPAPRALVHSITQAARWRP